VAARWRRGHALGKGRLRRGRGRCTPQFAAGRVLKRVISNVFTRVFIRVFPKILTRVCTSVFTRVSTRVSQEYSQEHSQEYSREHSQEHSQEHSHEYSYTYSQYFHKSIHKNIHMSIHMSILPEHSQRYSHIVGVLVSFWTRMHILVLIPTRLHRQSKLLAAECGRLWWWGLTPWAKTFAAVASNLGCW
jgi:hypothetical protein